MPATQKAQKFFDTVSKSGLIPEETLNQAFGTEAEFLDEDEAAERLLKMKLLTPFQAKLLRAGVWKGLLIGPYKILDQIGRGGMGIVYLGEHQKLQRQVAIKILPKEKTKDKLALDRFYREARAVAALDHVNIVKAHDVNEQDGVHYFVMEYVKGYDLQRYLNKKGPIPWKTAVGFIAQACWGLQHASTKGLVHRDIKPGNLLVDKSGALKILDLGLARCFSNDKDNLTANLADGSVMGSIDFIAPEQALGSDSVDTRTDIYSLGATFFTLVTGKPVFEGSYAQKLTQHQLKAPPHLHEVCEGVPKELSQIVRKMMAKDQEDRYTCPAEVAEALAPWLNTGEAVRADGRRTDSLPQMKAASTGEITNIVNEDMYTVWTSDTKVSQPIVTVEIDPEFEQDRSKRRQKKVKAELRRRKNRIMLWSAGIGGMTVPLVVLLIVTIFSKSAGSSVQVSANEQPTLDAAAPPQAYPSLPATITAPPRLDAPKITKSGQPKLIIPKTTTPNPGDQSSLVKPNDPPAATTAPPSSPTIADGAPPPSPQSPTIVQPSQATKPGTVPVQPTSPPPSEPSSTGANDPTGIAAGDAAPEIDGEDLAGAFLRLSRFRGRVVLLSFWNLSSPNSKRLLSFERALAIHLQTRPFVLLGVNNDKPADIVSQMRANEIVWRSFKNQFGDDEPISKAWGVGTWPTLFLIDHKGFVRHKWTGKIETGPVELALELVLRECEADRRKR